MKEQGEFSSMKDTLSHHNVLKFVSRAVLAVVATAFVYQPVSAASAPLRTNSVMPVEIKNGLPFDEWLKAQGDIAFTKLLTNISPAGTRRGVVIASPSRANPDYYYHWTRDAAVVMDVMVRDYAASSGELKTRWWRMINDYVDFSRENQMQNAISHLGEPKFYVDGRPYDKDWGRPQNDGPALRAVTLINFARLLLQEGNSAYVRTKLYDGLIPANTVIKADLEYTAHHWREQNFDLWEEVKGDHFYTRMAQYRSMRDGAQLAREMGDHAAAVFYDQQGDQLRDSLNMFWDAGAGFIRTSVNISSWDRGKGGLDTATILAVLHAGPDGGDFSLTDSRILATAERIDASFAPIYGINNAQNFPNLGNAIGRYPEDTFEGKEINIRGNPWILATAAMAEFHYKLATRLQAQDAVAIDQTNQAFFRRSVGGVVNGLALNSGVVVRAGTPEYRQLVNNLVARGDAYMSRIRYHSKADGSLDEQFDRDSGYMTAAHDLTWSYASFVTARWARP